MRELRHANGGDPVAGVEIQFEGCWHEQSLAPRLEDTRTAPMIANGHFFIHFGRCALTQIGTFSAGFPDRSRTQLYKVLSSYLGAKNRSNL